MFKAIRRWWRVYVLRKQGLIDEDRKRRMQDPYVVTATFDEIIESRVSNLNMFKRAVASTDAQREDRIFRLKALTADAKKKEEHRVGAGVLLKRLAAKFQKEGKTEEDLKQDPEYKKLVASLRDATSTLKALQDQIEAYEKEIGEYGKAIEEQKLQLQQAWRDLEKLKTEKNDTVADVIIAKQRKEVADIMTGLAEDRYAKDLQDMREIRRNLKSEAKISEELAGMSNKLMEQQLEKAAQDAVTEDEIDELLGFKKKEKPAEVTPAEEESVGEKSSGVLPGSGL